MLPPEELVTPSEPTIDSTAPPVPESPVDSATESPINTNAAEEGENEERAKRNSGRSGPTTCLGKALAARNALRHGLCSRTLILDHENEEDYNELLATWSKDYGNPAEGSVLHTFLVRTAQANWVQLRAVNEYDLFLAFQQGRPMVTWAPDVWKTHELITRYKTASERTFQREYRMLELHHRNHPPVTAEENQKKEEASAAEPQEPEVDKDSYEYKMSRFPKLFFVNNETGESRDLQGNHYPPPPNYVPTPIIPGVYPPDHPSNWRPPKEEKKKIRKH